MEFSANYGYCGSCGKYGIIVDLSGEGIAEICTQCMELAIDKAKIFINEEPPAKKALAVVHTKHPGSPRWENIALDMFRHCALWIEDEAKKKTYSDLQGGNKAIDWADLLDICRKGQQ